MLLTLAERLRLVVVVVVVVVVVEEACDLPGLDPIVMSEWRL